MRFIIKNSLILVVLITFVAYFTNRHHLNTSTDVSNSLAVQKINSLYANELKLKMLNHLPPTTLNKDLESVKYLENNKVCHSNSLNLNNTEKINNRSIARFDMALGNKNCQHIIHTFNYPQLDEQKYLMKFNSLVSKYSRLVKDTRGMNQLSTHLEQQMFKRLFYKYADLITAFEGTKLMSTSYFILGDIALRSKSINLYMVGPVILSKVILSKSNKQLAKYAWLRLNSLMIDKAISENNMNLESWNNLIYRLAYKISYSN